MKIGFIGLGKLGFPCAVAMEQVGGHEVRGFDIDPGVSLILKERKAPYIESLFEDYLKNITLDSKSLHHEEHIMSLMYFNHQELFEKKHFDIWWFKGNAPEGVPNELFEQNKSFYKILEELN